MLYFLGQTALVAVVILALWYAGDWVTSWRKARSKKKVFFLIVCEFRTDEFGALKRSLLAGSIPQKDFPTAYAVYNHASQKFAEDKGIIIEDVIPIFFAVRRDEI